jgi:magnesium transporter
MMLYRANDGKVTAQEWNTGEAIPPDVLWLDLLEPTREQEIAVEAFLGMEIPTREEMSAIEVSNRLYEENGALFLTATMLAKMDTGAPETHAVTFIVSPERLVTVRYRDTTSFRRFSGLIVKSPPKKCGGITAFLSLIEAIINRQADILERMDRTVDSITRDIFKHREPGETRGSTDYQLVLEQIGRCGDIIAKTHESLVTFSRVIAFAGHHEAYTPTEIALTMKSIRHDISGLSDHGNHLASRINFLLDATLGMVSIQQNGVFRMLSIISLIFLPPTWVAGVYGMNFKHMPELAWGYGYPLALSVMLLAAILPLAYLRQRRWL